MSAKSSENYKVCPLEGCSAKYNIPSSYERHLVQKHQKPKRFLAEHPFDGQPDWVAPAEPPVPTLTQLELDRADCACPVAGCGVEFKYISTHLTHLKRTHKISGKKAADAIKQLEGKEVGEEGNEPGEEGDLDGEGKEKEEGKDFFRVWLNFFYNCWLVNICISQTLSGMTLNYCNTYKANVLSTNCTNSNYVTFIQYTIYMVLNGSTSTW